VIDFALPQWWLGFELVLISAGFALSVLMIGDVLRQRRAPGSTAAWLMAILLLPYVGILLYLLFGARKLPRPKHRLGRLQTRACDYVPEQQAHPLDLLMRGLGLSGAVDGNHVIVHETPEQAFAELLRLINAAKQRIIIDMYGYADDPYTQQILDVLRSKAQQNIAVYMLIDDIGSVAIRLSSARDLKLAGARLVRFKPVSQLARLRILNLRNHRKIVVVDGNFAWTGGRNWGEVYFAPLRSELAWQDLSCSISGPAARQLEDVAISDWRFSTGEKLSFEAIEETRVTDLETAHNARVQIVPSGPDLRDDTWHALLMAACFTAKRRLWLVAPYFVPDEALQGALSLAARRGIDLRIIVPKKSDNLLVDLVRMSYLRDLMLSGAQIFRYTPRMLHAKAVLLDDSCAAIGSANLDARSLFLNYEVMVLLYAHTDIFSIGSFMQSLQHESDSGVKKVSWLREAMAAPLRLLSPLL
jgi:cardiolipin synthase A/B